MVKTKRLAFLALFLCISLVIHYFESLIPPLVPIAGVKMGLANCITLIVFKLFGRREAAAVHFMRIVIASLFFGGFSQFLYSICGGILAFSIMCVLINRVNSLWVLSAMGAVFHNIGQVAAAVFITKIGFFWWYLFPLTASAIISGVFVGLVSTFILKNKYILGYTKHI